MKRFTITGEWHGSRLDRFVRVFYPGMPFSVIQILLRKGLIYLNGSQATGNVRLTAGDVVAINIAEADENGISPTSASPKARARRGRAGVKRPRASSRGAGRLGTTPSPRQSIGTDIPVLYEDDALLIIDKPAGLVVHPGNRWEKGSLLDLLEEYRRMTSKPRENSPTARAEPSRGAARDAEPPFRYTPVHRLDRETSGALIVAKTRPAARALSRSIARGTVLKTYIAVVEGIPVRPTGEISTPLRTRKTSRSHSSPAAEGKEASTRYTTLATFPGGRTMLEVSIRRGRTHQIRAHLGSIGHPIVGDEKYGAPANAAGKILLHAWKVQLPHPVSETTLVIEAAPPKEFKME